MRLVNDYDVRNKIVNELQKAGLYFEIKISYYSSKDSPESYTKGTDIYIIKSHENQEEEDCITFRTHFYEYQDIEQEYIGYSSFGYGLENYERLEVWGFAFHEYYNFNINNLIPKILPYIKYGYRVAYETTEEDGRDVICYGYILKKENETIFDFKKRIEETYKTEVYSINNYDKSIDITYKEIDY